jgi:adenylosuccinate synthase
MPGIVIVGAQWGDEGKGKITDLLAERADAVVRFQGGNNAGHTIVRNGTTYKLHLMPSGILHPGKLCVIGNGVVVDPKVLTDELDELRRRGVETRTLRISANAHLIMPYHMMLDHAGEAKLGKLEIGTTRRGIGPCYADKAARLGIRVQDLLDEKILKKKIVTALDPKRLSLRPYAKDPRLDLQSMTDEYLTYGHVLEPYIADTSRLVLQRLDQGDTVLFEGAQGALLDIDHGTYPFVTSSNPVAGAATIGAGVGPKDIDEVWGVTKAYGTRVGAGPFPTELDGPLADELRERGGEYGTTTGRPRRVGWIDLVALRYAARLNSLTALAITKLDVLSGFDPIRVCVRYRGAEGAEFDHFPFHQTVLHHAAGEYIEMPGFTEDLSECRSEHDLPDAARDYLRFVSDFVGVPVALVGVGPGREQVIWTEAGTGMAAAGAGPKKTVSAG